jgi:hypothetical protein
MTNGIVPDAAEILRDCAVLLQKGILAACVFARLGVRKLLGAAANFGKFAGGVDAHLVAAVPARRDVVKDFCQALVEDHGGMDDSADVEPDAIIDVNVHVGLKDDEVRQERERVPGTVPLPRTQLASHLDLGHFSLKVVDHRVADLGALQVQLFEIGQGFQLPQPAGGDRCVFE